MIVVTGWNNGRGNPERVYGLRVEPGDRECYFRRQWRQVQLRLPGLDRAVAVPLTASFWRSCPELRSPEIGAWLRGLGWGTWRRQHPPRFALRRRSGPRFRVVFLS
jgi:hypothetical protein